MKKNLNAFYEVDDWGGAGRKGFSFFVSSQDYIIRQQILELWGQLSERSKRSVLWDVPKKKKQEYLYSLAATADLVLTGTYDDEQYFLAVAIETIKNTGVVSIHFLCRDEPITGLYQAMGLAASSILSEHYREVISVVPRPFFGARKYFKSIGANELVTLSKCCYMADHERYVDGVLFHKHLCE